MLPASAPGSELSTHLPVTPRTSASFVVVFLLALPRSQARIRSPSPNDKGISWAPNMLRYAEHAEQHQGLLTTSTGISRCQPYSLLLKNPATYLRYALPTPGFLEQNKTSFSARPPPPRHPRTSLISKTISPRPPDRQVCTP